ncbi:MAG: PaaI family thioesterase [Deltaproteobacteria bacterium]|nr:PaaI family thioesterase [Deltaproteobacteria bacterium]MBW1944305.1 PaaI family thioesterase [Deltaproteobacteria bacterium]MBW2209089.1 PaaI family thioesterase [Deltaproteobacteria bacterium]
MKEEKVLIPKLEGHGCFACGTANPIGLNLEFYSLGDKVCTEITLGKHHEGWDGVVHGGIISTLLDEIMSWTIMYSQKVFLVTRHMNIKYVKPVLVGTPLKVMGKIVDVSKPPRFMGSAEIRDRENRLLVKGSGEFVSIAKDKLSTIPDDLKNQMVSLFARFPAS